MGIEYTLRVPAAAQEAVVAALAEHLTPMLLRLDPRASEPFPNVYANPEAHGLYICDNQTDPAVAAEVIRSAIDLLLLYSPSVSISRE